MREFEYFIQHTAGGVLLIEDMGNFAIDIFNDVGQEGVMVVDTNMGATRIFKFGPFIPDVERLPNNVGITLKQMPYSEGGVAKEVRTFLNSYPFVATSAQVIGKEEALSKCRDIIDYMRKPIY